MDVGRKTPRLGLAVLIIVAVVGWVSLANWWFS